MNAEVLQALEKRKIIYLTTFSRKGTSSTVPVWFLKHGNALYFTTQSDSLKVKRIRHTPKVIVHVGKRDGPSFTGQAEIINDPAITEVILNHYPRRYHIFWLFLGPGIKRRLKVGKSVVVKITPDLA